MQLAKLFFYDYKLSNTGNTDLAPTSACQFQYIYTLYSIGCLGSALYALSSMFVNGR